MKKNSEPRPHGAAKEALSSSDKDNTRPRPTVDDTKQRRVVSVDEASEAAEAVLLNALPQDENDAASNLSRGVVGGGIRPGNSELGGALPDDSDHAPHAMSAGSGYVFNHPLWPALEEYRPVDTHLWEDIRDMVLHVVAASVRPGLARPSVRLKLARNFIVYTHEHLGIELDLEELFTEHNARQFLEYAPQAGYPRTLHEHYPALARMILAVTGVRPDMKIFQPSVPAPYSPMELARCVSVVQTMRTTQRKRAGMLIFALAAGAGLSTRELIDLRWTDITENRIDIQGPHPRTVPILPDYRDHLVREEHEQEDDYVLLPHLPRDNTNIISNFLARLPAGRPNVRRLRATFHFELLSHGISAQDFVYLSGRASFTSLDSYIPLLPDRSPDLLDTIDSLFSKDHS